MSARADLRMGGGTGHVGLPLAAILAFRGRRVLVGDTSPDTPTRDAERVFPGFHAQRWRVGRR